MDGRFIYIPEEHMIKAEPPNSYYKTYKKFKYEWIGKLWDKVFNLALKKGYLQPTIHTSWNRSIRRVELDINKLEEQIFTNREAIERIHRNQIESIIVGRDVMRKIMSGDIQNIGYHDFTLNRPQFKGLTIKLVPWFEGLLLIPRD